MNTIWNALPETVRKHTHNFFSWCFLLTSAVLMGVSALIFNLMPTASVALTVAPAIIGFAMFSAWAWANK